MNGAELKHRREEVGLSQRELAKAVGVSGQCVSAWEIGTRNISRRRLGKLEKALSTDTEEWDNGGVLVLSWH
jgi:transcriptional regulator with XRE-family HTH domain